MRLLILTQVLDRDDAVLGFFHRWCELFASHVEQLVVVAQRVGRVELPGNVAVVSLGRERGAGKPAMLVRLWALLAGLRGARRPDAIWAHMVPKFVLYAAPVARARGIPLYLWYTHKGVDRALRMAVPLVRAVFTASEESFRLAGAEGKRVVTGHGIDAALFAPGPGPRDLDVLAVGRLAPSKAQHELLEALARLPTCPRTAIAGDILLPQDEPYRDRLHEQARRFGGRVEFLGAVPHPEMPALMRRASVLVSTSRTGSVDKVVLEAMAAGVLPLTCNEAFERLLGPELAGRLMFPQGDVPALAARLSALLSLPADERRALAGRLAAIVAEHHDVRRLVPAMVAAMEARR